MIIKLTKLYISFYFLLKIFIYYWLLLISMKTFKQVENDSPFSEIKDDLVYLNDTY